MEDQLSVVFDSDKVRGYYDRSDIEFVPPTHLPLAINVDYTNEGWAPRPGLTDSVAANNVIRFHAYERVNEVGRWIWLDSSGDFHDSIAGTTILSIPGCTDFSLLNLFNRVYISPHDRRTGMASEKVYVYDPDLAATARAAAGARATDGGAAFTATLAAAAGNVEVGTRLISYCFETNTGFRTKPIATPVVYSTSTASRKITLSNYDTGPAGTAKRLFLASKRIKNYDPLKKVDYELFFIPGGVINDNTTTAALDVNFFDADLIDSADYLNSVRETIPAGVFISYYSGRMVVGEPAASISLANVSKSGEPESFDETDGFIVAYPGEGENLTNGREYRSQFILTKLSRTLITQDNGLEPSSWKVDIVDGSIGCMSCFGIAKVGSSAATSMDILLMLDKSGIQVFNGSYQPLALTYAIERYWSTVDPVDYRRAQIVANVKKRKLYVALTTTTPGGIQDNMLVGDWRYGFDAENICWAVWTSKLQGVGNMYTSIDITGEADPQLYVASEVRDTIYQVSGLTDDGSDIRYHLQFAPARFDEDSEVYQFTAIKFRGYFEGGISDNIEVSIIDPNPPNAIESRDVAISGTIKWYRVLYNFLAPMASLIIRGTAADAGLNQKFILSKAILYGGIDMSETEH